VFHKEKERENDDSAKYWRSDKRKGERGREDRVQQYGRGEREGKGGNGCFSRLNPEKGKGEELGINISCLLIY